MSKGSANVREVKRVSLSDKYTKKSGAVFMTGVQALVRLVLEQARRDREAGFDTSGFVSGYRGSPLGGLDMELWGSAEFLKENNIHFQPAVNEELAATAIVGTQQVGLYPDAKGEGVFSMWYGKGVGADRASDALKHANLMGTSPKGGVLVVVGDDHGAKSSATAHQCDQAMESWLMPVLHPADFDEYIDFGLLGYAMSRYAGCYVGFKVVSETVEAGAIVELPDSRSESVEPDFYQRPPDGLNIRWPDQQLAQEARHVNHRLKAAQAFARANGIDREVWSKNGARIGVITVGKAQGDFLQAIDDLGFDERTARSKGIALYKVGMPWPLDPGGVREFAEGLDIVLIIEEKRSFVERQVKDALFNMPGDKRPAVIGKEDLAGEPLLPSTGQLTSANVALSLVRVIPELRGNESGECYLAFLDQKGRLPDEAQAIMRIPSFCAGCPHSVSTKIPEGSRAHAGTGCHLMAAFMDRGTTGFLQMGGDGINWTGQAPFTKTKHVFQNIGDGTYFHSGSLAIRQAVAANVNMTFKILNNDAVAMTGGQPFESPISPADISQQVYSEGVRRIAVVYDRAENLPESSNFAAGTTFHPRRELDDLQRELREVPGVSVIIYVQPCAAELRRKRRRGEARKIERRVFINPDVCEGCGDCAVQSNCPALNLLETPMGRKRQIDQSMCNGDLTCLEGLCPAFVSVDGQLSKVSGEIITVLPEKEIPQPSPTDLVGPFNIIIAGVGGNGIITLGHILAMAALQEGKGATTLNFTGLAQKGGGVISHVRLSEHPGIIQQPRIPCNGGDLLLAGDLIMACSDEAVEILNSQRSAIVSNTYLQPTAEQIADGDISYDGQAMKRLLTQRAKEGSADFFNATQLAQQLTGQSIAANLFLLGYAFQKGQIPLQRETILNAITLNGAMVDINCQSFEWGRLAAHDVASFEEKVGPLDEKPAVVQSLDKLIERLSGHLEQYQNAAYARRYRDFVESARIKESEVVPGSQELTRAVANSYARLLAYKDEYEVARLHTEKSFAEGLLKQFDGAPQLSYHLAPDLLSGKNPVTGRLRKRAFGPWMTPFLKGLAKLKAVRGTPFDVFAYTTERRNEQALIKEYEGVIGKIVGSLTSETFSSALEIAGTPEKIKGFGIVKHKASEEVRRAWEAV